VQPARIPEAMVDGSPFTADIGFDFTSDGVFNISTFKTYLFSSLGRGGKAFFALDVTDPSLLTTANSAKIFRWIFTDTDDEDLGYIIGNNSIHPVSNQPTSSILTQNNRGFGLLLPNGIDSKNNQSVLYVLFSEGPELIKGLIGANPERDPNAASHQDANAWIKATSLAAPARYVKLVAPQTVGAQNGLVGVTWITAPGNEKAGYVYATDLNGKLWKFDINNADFTFWEGFESKSTGSQSQPPSPTLVFDANEGKSPTDALLGITSAPIIKLEGNDRVSIIFGTGNALTSPKFRGTNLKNRIYSILDTPSAKTTVSHASLSTRQLSESDGINYLSTSSDNNQNKGWVVYFPTSSGEHVISNPALLGDIVFVSSSAPAAGCVTQARAYAIDSKSGKAASSALGSTRVTIGGVTKQVNALGIKSNDQSSVAFAKSDGATTSVKIVGKTDNIAALRYYDTNRSQWRTIPGMKSTQ